jgi:hypothetical protein
MQTLAFCLVWSQKSFNPDSMPSTPKYSFQGTAIMTCDAVSAWIVPLKGHSFDLEDLPIYLSGSPVTVVKRNAGYFMQLSTSVTGAGYERVTTLANEYLALINGAAIVTLDGFQPIELGDGLFGIDANGEVKHTVLQVQSAVMRSKAGHVTVAVNGVALPDDRTGAMSRLLRSAAEHQAKADVLALIGRPSPTWSELYLVFELVEAHVGGRMYSEGWIGRADAKRFTHTANSYTALGKAGRHGKDTNHPPPKPLPHRAATVFMRSLVANWLKEIRAESQLNGG